MGPHHEVGSRVRVNESVRDDPLTKPLGLDALIGRTATVETPTAVQVAGAVRIRLDVPVEGLAGDYTFFMYPHELDKIEDEEDK